MSMIKTLRKKRGQALTEFILLFPLLFLVFLVLVQLVIVLNNGTRTQMAVWLGLRAVSIPEADGGWFGVSGKYSEAQVKAFIKEDFWQNKGDVDITYDTDNWWLIKKNKIEIKSRVPFLYRGLSWDLIKKAFAGIVKDEKIEAKAKGVMLKF